MTIGDACPGPAGGGKYGDGTNHNDGFIGSGGTGW